MEASWRRLPLDDRRSLRFSNLKVTKNEDNFKKLNDWVKDKISLSQFPVSSANYCKLTTILR